MPQSQLDRALRALTNEPVQCFEDLAKALRAQSDRILRDCRELALKSIPTLNERTVVEFDNDLAAILETIAQALGSGDPAEVRSLLTEAPKHGSSRYRLRFDLFDLLQEGRILRGVMLVRVEEELGRACTFKEAASLHALIDLMNQQAVLALVGEQQDRLEVAKEAAQIGLHVYDVREGTVDWDARTRALFESAPDEPISYDRWRELVYPRDRAKAEKAVRAALDPAGSGHFHAQYRVRRRKGGLRWIEATGRATFKDGEPVRLIGTVQDITEEKRRESAMKKAEQRKDEFIAMLAHELRNPLAPIRMAATVLEGVDDDPAQYKEMVNVIQRQSDTMARLIDDLLDVSRITRGKITLHTSRIDLASLIAHSSETIRPICDSKGLEFVADLPEKPITIEGDSVRLAQVVNNLLSNATKFTPRGGSVRISAQVEDGDAVIRVADSGQGIAPDDHESIFDMFTQAERSKGHTAVAGLGLGLPLVRSLVEMHNGEVSVNSELGEGSEFTVRLPIVTAGEAEPTQEDSPAAAVPRAAVESKPARTVLVVDDNEDALRAVELLLRGNQHTVRIAENGRRALELAEQLRPEVIVLDIGLPDMDGYEVARAIRKQSWGKDMRLIAMTGWGQERDKDLSKQAGFDSHLTKPADPELLEELITERPVPA